MGTLTNREKDALEDVFLSIHSNKNRYKKIKAIESFVATSQISTALAKLLKQVKIGLKMGKS
jgi:3-methyladenine DNA glycosylase Tag